MTQNSTSNNQIASIGVDINPLTGEWVSIVSFDVSLPEVDFRILQVKALGMRGVHQLRRSLCKRTVYIDFEDTDLSEHEVHSISEEIADELTGEANEEPELQTMPLFSHAKI